MKIKYNENGTITASLSIPKELEQTQTVEDFFNYYLNKEKRSQSDLDLNEIFEDSELSLIIGALNNFFPKFKGLPDEGKRCEELEELIHFIEESC